MSETNEDWLGGERDCLVEDKLVLLLEGVLNCCEGSEE